VPKNPQLRFLVRAVGCLAASLALWWILLMDPMMGALRLATRFAMQFLPGDAAVADATIQADGNWLMRMPIPESVAQLDSTQRLFGRVSKDSPPVRVRSLKLPISSTYPILFSVSLPVFWALWLAAPGKSESLRGLLTGSGILALISVVSLVFYCVYTAKDALHLMPTGTEAFLFSAGRYLVIDVAPYAGPLLLVLWFHQGLQNMVFSWAADPPAAKPRQKTR
jgi:hypothetical protein